MILCDIFGDNLTKSLFDIVWCSVNCIEGKSPATTANLDYARALPGVEKTPGRKPMCEPLTKLHAGKT